MMYFVCISSRQVLAMIATRGPDTQKLVTSHCSALLAADPKSTVDTLVSGSSFIAFKLNV